MITKQAYEEFVRYHDFTRWLATDEHLESATVKCYLDGTEQAAMIDNVSCDPKRAIYTIKGGVSESVYEIKIQVTTSTAQKFEDHLELKVL